MAMPPLITLIIVYHDQIVSEHLGFLMNALNRQSHQGFNTFWIDQTADSEALWSALKAQAEFEWHLLPTQHPTLASVRCWELHSPFAFLLEHPAMGKWFSYLHLECLPETDLIAQLSGLLPEIEAQYGLEVICMLHQLWCDLEVRDLHPRYYLEQLRLSEPKLWERKIPYSRYKQSLSFAYWEYRWEEDAFIMPSALARDLQLYSAVREPLYFQDLFDIFEWLSLRPYGQRLRWIRMQDTILYHLRHPRPFKEFSREFLDAVREHPEIFGHLALYDVAQSELFYSETQELRALHQTNELLNQFYNQVRRSPRGTLSRWLYALDRVHGFV